MDAQAPTKLASRLCGLPKMMSEAPGPHRNTWSPFAAHLEALGSVWCTQNSTRRPPEQRKALQGLWDALECPQSPLGHTESPLEDTGC